MTVNSDARPRWWLAALGLCLFAAVALRVHFASGFLPIDDAEYARVAYQIQDGTFTLQGYGGPPVVPLRSGIVLPTSAMFWVFGASEWAMAAYPLLTSLAILLIIYFLTAHTFDRLSALVAAGIWAFFPADIMLATGLRPDNPSNAWAMLGVLAIYLSRLRLGSGIARSAAGGVAAGIAFGISWLCKESVVYLIPFCAILLVMDFRKNWKESAPVWAGVALGSLAVLFAETVFYFVQTGDWFYRLHATEKNYDLYPEFFFAEGSRFGYEEGTSYLKAVLKRVLLTGPQTIFLNESFLYVPFFAALASLHAVYWRDSRFNFTMLLFWSLVLMFNFGTASLSSYQPLPLFGRYFHTLCIPAAILAGGLVGKLTASLWQRRREGRQEAVFWGAIVAATLTVVTLYSTFRLFRDQQPQWSSAEQSLASTIAPRDTVYTDPLSRAGLEFFWRYPQQMNVIDVDDMRDEAVLACNSYVLYNRDYADWLELNYGMWLTLDAFNAPGFFRNPPPNWERLWTNQNATLFRVRCVGTN
jgi:4-amino-4-deoxy-L-arabinose transferase-like glycosyltransferase